MLKITAPVRAALRTVVDRSRDYDAATLRVTRDGAVTALKSADKTCAGYDPHRYVVGFAAEMVGQDGAIREGY